MKTVKKITLLVVAAAVVIGCIFAAGCTGDGTPAEPTLTISVEKTGGYTYNVGDKFSITLPSNPSTGYSWQVTTVADGLTYEEIESADVTGSGTTGVSVTGPQTVGAPTSQTFVFSGTKEGNQPFEISYVRSGEDAGIYVYSDFMIVKNDGEPNYGSFVYDGVYVPTVGDKVRVMVAGTPASTGHVWKLHPSEGLTVLSEAFVAADSELAGASGMYIWTLTATQPGVYEIIGECSRGNEADVASGFFLPITFQAKLS
ncbi:MAG TPA: protease inhibitor I42 family protein [Methanocorpusculum sp.]|nr:protease inhibitor I42 family protein [Methanocorpusculum sp.]